MLTLSSDPDMQAYFRRDPLIGKEWMRARFFRTLHGYRALSFDNKFPFLPVHPGAESWTPTAMSMAVFEKMTGPKQFRELTNGAHLPIEQPAFDELGGAIRDLLENVVSWRCWIRERAAPATVCPTHQAGVR